MLYLVKITVYSALMYGLYLLILKNHTDHKWSRLYLLSCAIAPLLVPALKITAIGQQLPFSKAIAAITLPVINIYNKEAAATWSINDWDNIILYSYLFICFVLLCRLVYDLLKLWSFAAKYKPEIINEAAILKVTGIGPGSFGRYVFVPGNDVTPAILEHEIAHVRLHHSLDIVLLRLIQCFVWPNIILSFIRRELQTVHEFQADDEAKAGNEAYTQALLNNIFATNHFSLTHTFFHHPIKRRIMMLEKTVDKNRRTNRLKTIITTIALLAGIVYLQSYTQVAHAQIAHKKAAQDSTNMPDKKGVYTHAAIMPQPTFDMMSYLQENIKYPPDARKRKAEGRVVVKFVVDKDGSITKLDIVRSPDSSLSAEALAVISKMPNWTPGKLKDGTPVPVYFYQPVSFQLQ